MVLGEIEAFASLSERLFKAFKKYKKKDEPKSELVSTRFVRLFESHGIHRNQIPRVIGHNLSIADVQSDEHLLPKLTENIIETACELFKVRREWIDGAEDKIYPTHDFYKNPNGFKLFIEKIVRDANGPVYGVLLDPENPTDGHNALLLLQETVGHIGEKSYYRYYLCNNWAFTYWKARAYLTACVAHCWANNAYVHGLSVPSEYINSIAYGTSLLGWQGEGIWEIDGTRWYAEDMACLPDVFLNGVNRERDNYGIKSGLELWLKLEEAGHMYYGVEGGGGKQRFMEELQKYA